MEREHDEKGRFVATHSGTKTRLYKIWCSMKERCLNPNNGSYPRYGGRGVIICDEWINDFSSFREWALSNGYDNSLTIDRINSDGNYEPNNCRWTDYKTQNRNYSRNHLITYKGKTQCLVDWANELGINRSTIAFRLKEGKTLDEVFSKYDGRSVRRGRKKLL